MKSTAAALVFLNTASNHSLSGQGHALFWKQAKNCMDAKTDILCPIVCSQFTLWLSHYLSLSYTDVDMYKGHLWSDWSALARALWSALRGTLYSLINRITVASGAQLPSAIIRLHSHQSQCCNARCYSGRGVLFLGPVRQWNVIHEVELELKINAFKDRFCKT